MSVPNKPFWLSIARNEFGANESGTGILNKAGLAIPGWIGELAGKSSFSVIQPPKESFTYYGDAKFLVVEMDNNLHAYSEEHGWYQMTIGICQIRFSLSSWSGYYQNEGYINCDSGVAFTPDGTERGVKTNEMFSMGYTSSVFNVEFIRDDVVVAIYTVNCEVESH